jgi:hypothetical protein
MTLSGHRISVISIPAHEIPLGSPEEIHFPGTNFLVPTKRKVSSGKCDVSPIGDLRITGCGMPATSAAIAFFAEDFW